MIIHKLVWENKEHTKLTAYITNEKFNNIPYGVDLSIKDDSPIYNEIIREYESGNIVPEEYTQLDDDLAFSIRTKRDFILNYTDKYMMPDYPISFKQRREVRKYRKLLRDITKQYSFPNSVEWPKQPSFINN